MQKCQEPSELVPIFTLHHPNAASWVIGEENGLGDPRQGLPRIAGSQLLHRGCLKQRLLMEICLLLEQGMSRKRHGRIRCSLVALERCHVHGHAHLGVLGEGATREGLRQRGVGAAGTQHQPRSQGSSLPSHTIHGHSQNKPKYVH